MLVINIVRWHNWYAFVDQQKATKQVGNKSLKILPRFNSLRVFRSKLMFKTPGLPFVPAIAVTVNIYLIFKLSILTLVRFTFWMTIGRKHIIFGCICF